MQLYSINNYLEVFLEKDLTIFFCATSILDAHQLYCPKDKTHTLNENLPAQNKQDVIINNSRTSTMLKKKSIGKLNLYMSWSKCYIQDKKSSIITPRKRTLSCLLQ